MYAIREELFSLSFPFCFKEKKFLNTVMKYFMSVLSAVIRCGIRRAIKHKDFRPAYDYQSLN